MWLKKIQETDLDMKYSKENAIEMNLICRRVGKKNQYQKVFYPQL